MNSENFGSTLRKLRKAQGLTQKQLAEKADISATSIVLLERGANGPMLGTAEKLCHALGYEITIKRKPEATTKEKQL